MRLGLVSGQVACSMLLTTAGTALAQDEDLRMGDDPAYFERVEIAGTDLAASFPADWTIQPTMDEMAGKE